MPYLQATTYYFVYHLNILLTRKSRLNTRLKNRTRFHSFMLLNRASDVPAADWLSQTREKLIFTCGDTVFLSDGIPCKELQFM